MAINIEGNIYLSRFTVSEYEIIVRDNVGDNVVFIEEILEEEYGLVVAAGAIHGSDDGIAGEDSGAGSGEYGVASGGGGSVEVSAAD